MSVRVLHGDMLALLPTLEAESIHAVVCDPPYHLTSIVKRFGAANAAPAKHGTDGAYARASRGFMGKTWDGGDIAFQPETWAEVFRVMKPGAHLVAFGGTRTYHRMACAIEDAGFEIRDQLAWMYGSGFPKSHNAERSIAVGTCLLPGRHFASTIPREAEREAGDHICPSTPESASWTGWGTALKPAWEPIVLARKPLGRLSVIDRAKLEKIAEDFPKMDFMVRSSTVAANVLAHGCGAINVDACRVAGDVPSVPQPTFNSPTGKIYGFKSGEGRNGEMSAAPLGRWPANLAHDGSDEVEAAFAAFGEKTSGRLQSHHKRSGKSQIGTFDIRDRTGETCDFGGDSGSASRFFFCSKATAEDRAGSRHPTVKPLALMDWLVKLITPPGGTILDPFAGSGTTLLVADRLGFDAIGIEREAEYVADIHRRLNGDCPLFSEVMTA